MRCIAFAPRVQVYAARYATLQRHFNVRVPVALLGAWPNTNATSHGPAGCGKSLLLKTVHSCCSFMQGGVFNLGCT